VAGKIYLAAVTMAPKEIGSHESTWGQARQLMAKLGATNEEQAPVKEAFAHLTKGA
jgi:hypothetical protein